MILLIAALASSALDLNDNHEIAGVTNPAKGIPEEAHFKPEGDSLDNFLPGQGAPEPQQVQDHLPCLHRGRARGRHLRGLPRGNSARAPAGRVPEFRNHVFAISSVSGGSLGAAVFASVTKALFEGDAAQRPAAPGGDRGGGGVPNQDVPDQPYIDVPCPSMRAQETLCSRRSRDRTSRPRPRCSARTSSPARCGHPLSRLHAALPALRRAGFRPRPLARAGLRGGVVEDRAGRAQSI